MKKGIIQLLIANIINLLLGIVTGFVLPKYLSVDDYAIVRTFQLYISYIGFLHLGLIDGVYLLYGGKQIEQIPSDQYKQRIQTFKVFQIAVSILVLLAAFVIKDWVLLFFALSIYPYNLAMYYKLVCQAVGKFKQYSYIINFSTLLAVIGIVILMILHIKEGILFVAMYLVSYIVVAVVTDIIASRRIKGISGVGINFKDAIQLVKSGFTLMLGNFSSILLTGMDRWCVKLFISGNSAFAFYSFAVSMQAMVEVLVSPVTIVLYNFLCNEKDEEKINEIKRMCLLAGCVLISLAFPCKMFVEWFLQTYTSAVDVLCILFATELLYVLIRGIYINLYKAEKKQTIYFRKLIYVIIIALILNITFFFVMRRKEAFAYATLVSSVIWLVLCCGDFEKNALNMQEWGVIVTSIVALLLLEHFFVSYIGFVLYLIYLMIMALICFRNELKYAITMCKGRLKKKTLQ